MLLRTPCKNLKPYDKTFWDTFIMRKIFLEQCQSLRYDGWAWSLVVVEKSFGKGGEWETWGGSMR
jgi:hypothetical protein